MKNIALIAALVFAFVGSKVAFATEEAHATMVKCDVNGTVSEMTSEACAEHKGTVVTQ